MFLIFTFVPFIVKLSFKLESSFGMIPLNICYWIWTSWKPWLHSHVLCSMRCDAIDHIQTQTFLSPETELWWTVATRNQVKYRKQCIKIKIIADYFYSILRCDSRCNFLWVSMRYVDAIFFWKKRCIANTFPD